MVALVAACVGGPGSLPDDQGGSQTPSIPTATATTTSRPPSSNGGGGSAGGSSGGSGTVPEPQRIIVASEFDQSCTENDDECSPVFIGSMCSPCQCPNAAISAKDMDKYKKLASERGQGCAIPDIACSPCQPTAARCNNRRCGIAPVSLDGG